MAAIAERRSQLEAKLAEYTQRLEVTHLAEVDLEQVALHKNLKAKLQAFTLRSVLELSSSRNPTDRVTLRETALAVQDRTGLQVTPAATVPFKYSESEARPVINWSHVGDGEVNMESIAFLEVYKIIQAYCSGDTHGLYSGTGLPNA